MEFSSKPGLRRELGLIQATSLAITDMVGIGPYITIPLLLATMGGPQCMLGWLVALVIAVCDDPALHSSQNEQDTRYFSVHSNIPLLDAGSPQEAYQMTRDAFEISEKLQLPIIVRLTTRVAHGKARVQIKEFQNINRNQRNFIAFIGRVSSVIEP